MRVRRSVLLLAALAFTAGCSDPSGIVTPSEAPAFSGGIYTIGSDGRDGSANDQTTSGTTDESTESRGIYTNGSGG